MNETFRALLEEATFTKEILASGVTQIRKANYTRKGVYFQCFTNLSTGLERIGKLCMILDYYIKNNGKFPNMNFVKVQIGHDLELLYSNSKAVINDHNISFIFSPNLDDVLHQEIIRILSTFAKGNRYANINFLVSQIKENDPIFDWHEKIDKQLYATRVSEKLKKKIETNAEVIDILLSLNTLIIHSSKSRKEINTVREASIQTGKNNAVSKYRQLYLLQIIRYWVEILIELQYIASNINKNDIPYFTEIFTIFYNENSYFLTRKTFDEL